MIIFYLFLILSDGKKYRSKRCGIYCEWNYISENKTLKILGEGDMKDWKNEEEIPWNIYSNETETIEIDNEITSIGSYSFSNFYKLKNLTLGYGLMNIGKQAFENCISLQNFKIPYYIDDIKYKTFYNCSSLTELEFPSLIKIEKHSFSFCTSLESIRFKNTVEIIENKSFSNCSSLQSIEYYGLYEPKCSSKIFSHLNKLKKIIVSHHYENSFFCKKLIKRIPTKYYSPLNSIVNYFYDPLTSIIEIN